MFDEFCPPSQAAQYDQMRAAQLAASRSLEDLLGHLRARVSPPAAHVLRTMIDFIFFDLAGGHATLREALTGDGANGPALPALHLWIRRTVAHTEALCGAAVSQPDRDTALLIAILMELGPCAEALDSEHPLTVIEVVQHGAFPGALSLVSLIAADARRSGAWSGDDEVQLSRVVEGLRQVERHPWIPVTSTPAALARAGRASAAALAEVPARPSRNIGRLRALNEAGLMPCVISRLTTDEALDLGLPF